MADKAPSIFTPWYETLKGMSRSSGSPSDIEGAPARRSYSSKVNPLDATAMRTTADSEPYSADRSSFSFSRSVNFGLAPLSPAPKSFDKVPVPGFPAPKSFDKVPIPGPPAPKSFDKAPIPGPPAPKSFEKGPVPGPPAPKAFEKGPVRGPPAPKAFARVPGSTPAPKSLDKRPPAQSRKEANLQPLPPIPIPNAPPDRPLSPPPISPRAKTWEKGDIPNGFTSASPATKMVQYQVGQDFIYHPKSVDKFYPSVKYDLGPEKKPSRVRRCCCWALFLILLVLMGLGIAVAVLIVELNPKAPSLAIGKVSVTSFNFTPSATNFGASQLAIGVNVPFNLTNPNKHADVLYNEISMSVSFQDLFLGSTNTIPAFAQGTKGTNFFSADLPTNVTSVPSNIADSLTGQIQNADVQIDLGGSVNGKYRILGHNIKHFSIPIACGLIVTSNGPGNQATVTDISCHQ